MRQSQLILLLVTALCMPGAGFAEVGGDSPVEGDPPAATADTASGSPVAAPNARAAASGDDAELAWDRFDDPAFDPAAGGPGDADPAVEQSDGEASAESQVADSAPETIAEDSGIDWGDEASANAGTTVSGVVLGPQGVDDQGRTGRLHTVARGDTLWDLSAAYLGTPWVWPSVWIDNDDIDNPHLILPGDKIWITANEMRVVSDAEAESFLQPLAPETTVTAESLPEPVEEAVPPLAALDGDPDDPSTLDAFPVAIPGQDPGTMAAGRQVTVARRETMGFVPADDLAGASSIVESPSDRTYLAAGDPVFVGMGEGDVAVGDQFTVFQVEEQVRDVETNRLLGYHVEKLGWIEIQELTGDTSIAEIRHSSREIERGARLMPREVPSRRVTTRSTPDAIEGQIVFLPSRQTVAADGGYVYLNRGEFHGIEVGSELDVYDSGRIINERQRRVDVRTPDTPVARIIVVSVEEDSSVAFVLSATRELMVGDSVRPAAEQFAGR
jgi:hypothetical protein